MNPQRLNSIQSRERRVSELMAEREEQLPVWVRAPKYGTEHYSGLSRGTLYELATAQKIRSVNIRAPGQIRGSRLFHLQSIIDYLESNESYKVKTTPTE